MIHTTLQNISRYASITPRLQQCFEALQALREQPFSAGRHPVDGDNIFIKASEYETKPMEQALPEAHREYIDVMLLLSGEERIAYCDLSAAGPITKPYDETRDVLFTELPDDVSTERMLPDDVVILFPEDVHAPGLDTDGTHKVQKLIAKVRI